MQNRSLIEDYLIRSEHRLAAIELLFERKSWADVVRESQEVVELVIKALLRSSNIEVPRIHELGDILIENQSRCPKKIQEFVPRLSQISRELRRDRELAFYGSEDLTPSQFYKEPDAEKAKENAAWALKIVAGQLLK
jgi:hypothetical protein